MNSSDVCSPCESSQLHILHSRSFNLTCQGVRVELYWKKIKTHLSPSMDIVNVFWPDAPNGKTTIGIFRPRNFLGGNVLCGVPGELNTFKGFFVGIRTANRNPLHNLHKLFGSWCTNLTSTWRTMQFLTDFQPTTKQTKNKINNKWRLHYRFTLLSSMCRLSTMNFLLNAIKSQRRYNDKTTAILLRALVRWLVCVVLFIQLLGFKTVVSNAGSSVQPINEHLLLYSSSCAAKVPALELKLRKFLIM